MVSDLGEIFFPQAEERRSIKLGVPTNVVVRVRMEVFAILVDIDQLRVPVGFLARNVIAPLENEDSLARRCEMIRQRASAGARADNDYVITVAPDSNPPFAPQKMHRLLLTWCSLQQLTSPLRRT